MQILGFVYFVCFSRFTDCNGWCNKLFSRLLFRPPCVAMPACTT